MAYTTINKSTDYFNTKLYTGNGSARSITGVGFQPDMVWVKKRSHADNHPIHDVIRGATKYILTDTNGAEATFSGGLTSFDSDGYSLGVSNFMNQNTHTFASWNWKAGGAGSTNYDGSITSTVSANTTAGFSIVKYTGNQTSGATVGHGLGAVPKMIIVKNLNDAENWVVYHASLGNTKRVSLNLTEEETTDSTVWNNTTPTSSVFSLGNSDKSNNVNIPYIAYCFAEKTGYSKFGSYIGNSNNNGTFVYTGFKPSFVMIKANSAGENWWLWDNKREPHNVISKSLFPNTNASEYSSEQSVDFVSNGFKLRINSGARNNTGTTYIYMAFGQSLVGSNNVPCTAR